MCSDHKRLNSWVSLVVLPPLTQTIVHYATLLSLDTSPVDSSGSFSSHCINMHLHVVLSDHLWLAPTSLFCMQIYWDKHLIFFFFDMKKISKADRFISLHQWLPFIGFIDLDMIIRFFDWLLVRVWLQATLTELLTLYVPYRIFYILRLGPSFQSPSDWPGFGPVCPRRSVSSFRTL